jgi:mono/diheme cytochrome c family protein
VQVAPGTPDAAHGKELFKQFCTACHGDNGLGSHGGASLVDASKDINIVVSTATKGRGDMPSFKDVLKPEELRDIGGYITQGLFVPN